MVLVGAWGMGGGWGRGIDVDIRGQEVCKIWNWIGGEREDGGMEF
jgi:hypothetical protein